MYEKKLNLQGESLSWYKCNLNIFVFLKIHIFFFYFTRYLKYIDTNLNFIKKKNIFFESGCANKI